MIVEVKPPVCPSSPSGPRRFRFSARARGRHRDDAVASLDHQLLSSKICCPPSRPTATSSQGSRNRWAAEPAAPSPRLFVARLPRNRPSISPRPDPQLRAAREEREGSTAVTSAFDPSLGLVSVRDLREACRPDRGRPTGSRPRCVCCRADRAARGKGTPLPDAPARRADVETPCACSLCSTT